MTFINWDQPFYFDPTTFQSVPPGTEGAARLPTYGNYGGAGYSSGELGGELITRPDGSAYSYAQLRFFGDGGEDPADFLDYLFYRHDVAVSGPVYSPSGDIALLSSLIVLDASYDPEASLYAAGATSGMLGSLAAHGYLDELPLSLIVVALGDAVRDLEHALDNLPPEELGDALAFFFESTGPNTYAIDFTVTTSSSGEEFLEGVTMRALDALLDGGEADNAPLVTGFPFPGATNYALEFNVLTGDIDLLTA